MSSISLSLCDSVLKWIVGGLLIVLAIETGLQVFVAKQSRVDTLPESTSIDRKIAMEIVNASLKDQKDCSFLQRALYTAYGYIFSASPNYLNPDENRIDDEIDYYEDYDYDPVRDDPVQPAVN
jgi:hypothetical protein